MSQELLGVERFVEVGVDVHVGLVFVGAGPEVEAQGARDRGGYDDGDVHVAGIFLDGAGEEEAGIDAGHHQVGHDQVGLLLLHADESLLRFGSRDHAVARPLEDHAVDLEKVVIVVDDQDQRCVGHGFLTLSSAHLSLAKPHSSKAPPALAALSKDEAGSD